SRSPKSAKRTEAAAHPLRSSPRCKPLSLAAYYKLSPCEAVVGGFGQRFAAFLGPSVPVDLHSDSW
ncbi:hypothetical protein, partial [Novipirellula maiorica]|uniref:hypothetical protein n=1 Tax=Novipirellula maiorica TaxID=1265734 RepID=UPI001F39552F